LWRGAKQQRFDDQKWVGRQGNTYLCGQGEGTPAFELTAKIYTFCQWL